jgi:sulfatase maturation enzyme AslB (radical SAM superfamily)
MTNQALLYIMSSITCLEGVKMVGITKLLCGSENYGDKLRYVPDESSQRYGTSPGYGPVVVWNCTNQCNLHCKHCYANAKNSRANDELDTNEVKSLIDEIKARTGIKEVLVLNSLNTFKINVNLNVEGV